MADPDDVTDRLIRLITLHDKTAIDPSKITLASTWSEIGLNELDVCEICVEAEKEFNLWIPDEDMEKFLNLHDMV